MDISGQIISMENLEADQIALLEKQKVILTTSSRETNEPTHPTHNSQNPQLTRQKISDDTTSRLSKPSVFFAMDVERLKR